MKIIENKYFIIALRLIVGGLFIAASVSKIFNQEEFSRAIYNYKIPYFDSLINISAIIIPSLELVSGVFLIIGIFKRGSSVIISILLIMFIIFLSQAYIRGLDISCGCFSLESVGQKSDILQRIIEDILLLIATVLIFKYSNKLNIQEKSI
ncbi:MAG: hypothetical protein HGGPFJEG_02611 [Ignavibacteria bacterium]|nr:hypothetical protein [Ignavibacteria bacterium]